MKNKLYIKSTLHFQNRFRVLLLKYYNSCFWGRDRIKKKLFSIAKEYFVVFPLEISENHWVRRLYHCYKSKSTNFDFFCSFYLFKDYDYVFEPTLLEINRHTREWFMRMYDINNKGILELTNCKTFTPTIVLTNNHVFTGAVTERIELGRRWLEQRLVQSITGLSQDILDYIKLFL